MGYFNPIVQYGCEAFCRDAARAGVDGLIVVDLPPEESKELHLPAKKAGLALIYLLTPTSDEERERKVARLASGFLYYVSMTGITGAKLHSLKALKTHVSKLRKNLKIPICVGFGIRDPGQAHILSGIADGVVVGSALVSLLEENRGIAAVTRKVSALKRALHN